VKKVSYFETSKNRPKPASERRLNCLPKNTADGSQVPPTREAGEPEPSPDVFQDVTTEPIRRLNMGRGLLLWMVGIPLPIILVLYFLGYLH
jgi:hypothetical protein